MYNSETEFLFPLKVVPSLGMLRGKDWNQLVKRISSEDTDAREKLAFVLLMVRLAGCVSCGIDSFRAMKGCMQCSQQAIRRFRGSDEELIAQYKKMQLEIDEYLEKRGLMISEFVEYKRKLGQKEDL